MTTNKGNTRKPLKRPVAEVRAELLASEEVQQVARQLGLSLEEYVEKVLDYAQHPDKEPMLNVATDEAALKKAHPGLKTTAELTAELERYASGKAPLPTGPDLRSDGFEAPQPKKGQNPKG